MNKTATIILNRNLPKVTDQLYESLKRHNGDLTDIYVIESGSQKDNLSKYCSYWANWEESLESGLRYPRGFNYALQQLMNEGKFSNYDFFFLVCNDSVFEQKPVIAPLLEEMQKHTRLGILSPCSPRWGEQRLIKETETKYFWYINHIAWFMRREYIEAVMHKGEAADYMNLLYDGSNFRGYECDIELIIKGYANDWGSAITTKVWVKENEELLKTQYGAMKTDEFHLNRQKVLAEGKKWLRNKYGFNSRWTMQMYAKFFYEKFFEYYPELMPYKI